MRILKKHLVWIIFGIMVFGLFGCSKPQENKIEYYPATVVVTELDLENDTYTAVDCVGEAWYFEEIEDTSVGDVLSLIVCDMGTTEIYDDEVMEIRYSGTFEMWGN